MKKQPTVLVLILVVVTTIYAFSLGNVAYSQQGENSILGPIDLKNTNLTLGKPFYIEKFEIPTSQNNGEIEGNTSASSVLPFEGNGTLNDLNITASGVGDLIPRDDGTKSIIGKALFSYSANGTASYSFEAITNITQEGITTNLGVAFFVPTQQEIWNLSKVLLEFMKHM